VDGCEHVDQLVEPLGEQLKLEEHSALIHLEGLQGDSRKWCSATVGSLQERGIAQPAVPRHGGDARDCAHTGTQAEQGPYRCLSGCQQLTFSGFFALTASRSAMYCCLYASHSCTQTYKVKQHHQLRVISNTCHFSQSKQGGKHVSLCCVTRARVWLAGQQ
jgi:hypothetical protein